MHKKLTAIILAAAMSLNMGPLTALGAQTAGEDTAEEIPAESAAQEEDAEDEETSEAAAAEAEEEPAEELVLYAGETRTEYWSSGQEEDNEELFAAYVEDAFYGNGEGAALAGRAAALRSQLTDMEEIVYTTLKTEFRKVADGTRSGTEISLSPEDLGLDDVYTAEDLGLEYILDDGEISDQAMEALYGMIDVDFDRVITLLIYEEPYILYWFDKTEGFEIEYFSIGCSYSPYTGDGALWFGDNIVMHFYVAQEYAAGLFSVDTSVGQTVTAAVANAQSIVSRYASRSDYDKVWNYTMEICQEVSYDNEADYPYGNPWQMIYVFDGDPSTNVVCEGYAKAFKYLCDSSDFRSGSVECILATGQMGGETETGPHMWNIMTMEDGIHYLHDVTIFDGELYFAVEMFLGGALAGSPQTGYQFPFGDNSLYYYYDEDTMKVYSPDALTLSGESYEPSYEEPSDISECQVTLDLESCPYTGQEIVPGVSVYDGDQALTEGTDYEVTCFDNVNAGTAEVLVEGIGNYTGLVTKTFTITKATQTLTTSISSSVITAGESGQITVSGNQGALSFSSSNPAVLTVNSAGIVSALSAGQAAITVAAAGTENYDQAETVISVTVKARILETPLVSSVTNTAGGIKIAWNRVEGAEKYRIYYKEENGGWKKLADTAGTSYTWTGAESGKIYGFTLRCMNAAGSAYTSGYDNTGKSIVYIAAPSVTKLESLSGGVKITWTQSAGAALYRIYYKEGNGGWKKLADTAGTSYTWTGAQSGKTYGFTLRCMNAAGTSFTSGYDNTGMSLTYVKPVSIPEVTALSAVTGGLQISWSSYEGAGVYAIYYKTGTGAGGWKKLTNASGNTYTWTGAVDGTTYSFTVRAMDAAGTSFISGYNNTGMSLAYKALASIPKVTSVMNVQGGIKIAWSAFTGAGTYRIFYKEGSGAWKKLCDASGTSYTWTGAEGGKTYAFTVRAMNAAATSYVSGYDNTGKAITYVESPVITDLQQVTGGIRVSWGECAGAGSYRIFYKVNGGGWKKLADVTGTAYTWTGAASGNTYGFTVRCMDAGSASFVSGYDSTGMSLTF